MGVSPTLEQRACGWFSSGIKLKRKERGKVNCCCLSDKYNGGNNQGNIWKDVWGKENNKVRKDGEIGKGDGSREEAQRE